MNLTFHFLNPMNHLLVIVGKELEVEQLRHAVFVMPCCCNNGKVMNKMLDLIVNEFIG